MDQNIDSHYDNNFAKYFYNQTIFQNELATSKQSSAFRMNAAPLLYFKILTNFKIIS